MRKSNLLFGAAAFCKTKLDYFTVRVKEEDLKKDGAPKNEDHFFLRGDVKQNVTKCGKSPKEGGGVSAKSPKLNI